MRAGLLRSSEACARHGAGVEHGWFESMADSCGGSCGGGSSARGRATPRRSSAKIRASGRRLWCTEHFAANAPESVKSESVIRVCCLVVSTLTRGADAKRAARRRGSFGKHLFGGDRRVIQFGREEPVSAMARSPRGSDSVKSWWPFQRRVERRESAYSDAIVELIRARAAGVSTADATALGALEFCAGLWSRAFASATVSPDNFRTRALTPWMLSNAARALIRSGESIWDISVFDGAVRLRPAAYWDISGQADPQTWRYSLQLSGPTSSETINRPWAGVIHLQFGCDSGIAAVARRFAFRVCARNGAAGGGAGRKARARGRYRCGLSVSPFRLAILARKVTTIR